jgi:cytochrome oxidase Cu insertion factor (SCO1/SenC/PrrC family)
MTALPPQATPRRLVPKILALGGIIILILMVWHAMTPPPIATGLASSERKYFVPPFTLTERSGRAITNNDLLGKIWVADFIYTTCPGPCPLVSASMARFQAATATDPDVQLVTFTVDPTTDTPAVLSAYADKLGASKTKWWFLTGQEKQIFDVVRNGFMLPMEDNSGKPPEPGQYKVTHSTEVAVVDQNGVIQGYFDGLSADGRSDVLKAIAALEKR